jgi:hypothetical protein
MRGDRVWKRRSDRFAISVTQDTLRNLGKSGFQCPHQSLATRSFALRALLTGETVDKGGCGGIGDQSAGA